MTDAVLQHVIAPDGTPIGVWRSGEGPPLVLVHGASADHTRWQTVLPLLDPHLTSYAVDRRGRGASGDTPHYDVEREFDDVAAVVDEVAAAIDGPVDLLGHSFGGLVAFEAARRTGNVRRLVLYEPEVAPEDRIPDEVLERIDALVAAGDRDEAVATMFREVAGVPDGDLTRMRSLPAWRARIEAVHTVVRELRALNGYEFEDARFADVTVPALVMIGGESTPEDKRASGAAAEALPDSRVADLPGQGHVAMDTAPELFAKELLGFLQAV